MLSTNLQQHHSAEVRLFPEANHGTYRLAPIGPDDIIFAEAVDLPPCDGEVVMLVDGRETRWQVSLAEGASRERRKTPTVDR